MNTWTKFFAVMTICTLGCGDESTHTREMVVSPPFPSAPSPPPAPAGMQPGAGMMGMMGAGGAMHPGEAMMGMMGGATDRQEVPAADGVDKAVAKAEASGQATANRKIIYNANVDLVTEDLGKLENALIRIVEIRKAYVADSDRSGSAGSNRHGTWKIRVPVENYDAFLKDSVALGELVSVRADSQDVSEEFYDLEAREKAKKVEEERLLKHLADSTGKLSEILAVERELSRVRGEIERMQGRLRALGNLTTLATITVTAREIQGYVPPQAPTLVTKIGRTFHDSLDSLRQLGENVLLAAVAVVPWFPLILIGLLMAYLVTRRITPALRRTLARTRQTPV